MDYDEYRDRCSELGLNWRKPIASEQWENRIIKKDLELRLEINKGIENNFETNIIQELKNGNL